MSNKTNVRLILERLHQSSDIIAEAFDSSRIGATEENSKRITLLIQQRILTPDIYDTFQLRYSMRQFLNAVLNTNKLMDSSTDFSISFNRLDEYVNRHNDAFLESRDEDRQNYQIYIRDLINGIAGSIADELLHISSLVDSKFATVTTIAEKMKENEWYMNRATSILNLLETFSFSDIEQRLMGHRDLELSYDLLLKSRMIQFIETFRLILSKLDKYKYEFRKIEAQAKLLRKFSTHLNRYPDWTANDWSSNEELVDWMCVANPIQLSFYPDINDSSFEKLLVDIALNLPASKTISIYTRKRPFGILLDMDDAPVVKKEFSALEKAVNVFMNLATSTKEGMSARDWWINNPSMLNKVTEEYWVHRILSERINRKIGPEVRIDLVFKESKDFEGNVKVSDIVVSQGYANV